MTLFDLPAPRAWSTTHVVEAAGDSRSLCGIKNPLPRMLRRYVEAHRSYCLPCAACEAAFAGRGQA